MSNAQLERFGRRGIWFLIGLTAIEGSIGHYFLPMHVEIMDLIGPEFAAHERHLGQAMPVNDVIHRWLGLLLLVLGALQFDSRLRARRPQLHRWIGRTYLALGLTAIVGGLAYAAVVPFSGLSEQVFTVIVAAMLLFMLSRGWMAVRRRDFVQHRAWMIRGYALFLFVSMHRFLTVPMMLVPLPEQTRFVISGTLAVIVMMCAAEFWLKRSRPSAAPMPGVTA